MQAKALNPYIELQQKLKDAFDFIIVNLPASPTVEQLNEVALTAIFGAGPGTLMDDDIASLFLQTILPLSYNGYVNGGRMTGDRGRGTGDSTIHPSATHSNQSFPNTHYTENQNIIIHQLLEGIRQTPPEAMADFLASMEEKVASAELLYHEQLPLYAAIAAGKGAHEYWTAQLAVPGGWAIYFNANSAINYIHLNSWVAAPVQGVLLSYNLYDTTQTNVPGLFAGMVGGIALGAGKVVFGWNGKEF